MKRVGRRRTDPRNEGLSGKRQKVGSDGKRIYEVSPSVCGF